MKIITLLIILTLIVGGFFLTRSFSPSLNQNKEEKPEVDLGVKIIAQNLDTPWGLVFLPEGKSILVTERAGSVRLIEDGKLMDVPVKVFENVEEVGEGGLLGITIHPNFSSNSYVYLYYTYNLGEGNTLNRVVRMRYDNKQLVDEQIVVDGIPGSSNHNGGRIKFGPDNYLYITTGDAENPSQAQSLNSLSGKILRVTDDGRAAPGNPFNNFVYSYGHRNSQGLAWDSAGQLWATEHGRSGAQSGLDEINRIESGKNYGWPIIQGDQTKEGMEKPLLNSGDATWAPAGSTFIDSSLFFGGLRGQALYEVILSGGQVEFKEHFKGEFGRIRDVIEGPDGMLYITISNKDGRGSPKDMDDKIIIINPKKL